jgi:hypothetical protein
MAALIVAVCYRSKGDGQQERLMEEARTKNTEDVGAEGKGLLLM